MKVFYRTYFSFLGVIALQAVLVTTLVSGSIRKSQEQDSRVEAKAEALNVYDNFNSWKRALWGTIVDISKDEALADLVGVQASAPAGTPIRAGVDQRLQAYLKRSTVQSGAEFVVAKPGWSGSGSIISLSDRPGPAPQIRNFVITRPHPYVEVVASARDLYFCGNVRVRARNGNYLDLFILKRVDEQLCRQFSSNPNTRVLISADEYFATGTIGGTAFLQWLKGRVLTTSYYFLDDMREGEVPYMMVVQQSGPARIAAAQGGDREATLYVCSYLSLAEARNRIAFLNKSILTASLVIALFTAILSALLSKAVTDPISRLSKAMLQLKSGTRPVLVEGPQGGEIGRLLLGFNEMSAQLDADKDSLSRHLGEITRIKEYDDKIFDSIQERILVIDAIFTVEKANKAFLDYVGLDEGAVLGKNIDELSIGLFDEPIHESIRAIISGALPSVAQTRRTPAGHTFEIKFYPLLEDAAVGDGAGLPRNSVHCIMIIEDVTRKIAYEDKIRQAEKLASISMLSAGVAHEINNPLGSILANVQNLIKAEKEPASADDLLLIEKETKRIARIVRNLLEFSSAGGAQTTVADLNDVIEKLLQLLGYSLKSGSRVEVAADLEHGLPKAAIGEDECKQILLNLIMNALEAIEGAGRIVVRTRNLGAGGEVELTVSDTGKGIPPDLLPRIFDPFFSTKGENGNSGLGLSVVYGLVSKFKGNINVESQEGAGTTVSITLPAAPCLSA